MLGSKLSMLCAIVKVVGWEAGLVTPHQLDYFSSRVGLMEPMAAEWSKEVCAMSAAPVCTKWLCFCYLYMFRCGLMESSGMQKKSARLKMSFRGSKVYFPSSYPTREHFLFETFCKKAPFLFWNFHKNNYFLWILSSGGSDIHLNFVHKMIFHGDSSLCFLSSIQMKILGHREVLCDFSVLSSRSDHTSWLLRLKQPRAS